MRKYKKRYLLVLYLRYYLLAGLLKEDEKTCKPNLNGSPQEPFEIMYLKNFGFPRVVSQQLV